MEEHESFMQICLELARQALATGNPPVGSLVVREGRVIGRGREATKSGGDLSLHAEMEAIREAVRPNPEMKLSGCVLYSTHEPCLMCAYAIRHYRVSQVVFGLPAPHIGGYSSAYPILSAPDIPLWSVPPVIIGGIARTACGELAAAYRK